MNTSAIKTELRTNYLPKISTLNCCIVTALAIFLTRSATLAADPQSIFQNTHSPSEAINVLKAAVQADPTSTGQLLPAAYAAYHSQLAAFMEAAIRTVQANGKPKLAPTILDQAIACAPDQKAKLTALARKLMRDDAKQVGIFAPPAGDTPIPALGPLGGTINPANIGGVVIVNPVVSPEQ